MPPTLKGWEHSYAYLREGVRSVLFSRRGNIDIYGSPNTQGNFFQVWKALQEIHQYIWRVHYYHAEGDVGGFALIR